MLLFANDNLKAEYFEKLDSSVIPILADIGNKLSRDNLKMIITSIVRLPEKQKEICEEMGVPYYPTLHGLFGKEQTCHAVDFVTDPFCDNAYALALCEEINKEYPYTGHKKTDSLLWHQGTGLKKHFHLQTAVEN
jgi:hypothetical protein